jgi:hypothetical protein
MDPNLNALRGLDVRLLTFKLQGVGKEYLSFLAQRTLLLKKTLMILKLRGININKLVLRQVQVQVQAQRQVQTQRQVQAQRQVQIQRQAHAQRQVQRQAQAQRQVQTQIQAQRRLINPSGRGRLKMKLPKIRFSPKFRFPDFVSSTTGKSKSTGKKVVSNSFKIEVLRGKRYVRLGSKLYTERDARDRLAYALDRDKARTARIVNMGRGKVSSITRKEFNYLNRRKNKFRSYRILNKKKTNLSSVRLIEKRKYFNDLERLSKRKRR